MNSSVNENAVVCCGDRTCAPNLVRGIEQPHAGVGGADVGVDRLLQLHVRPQQACCAAICCTSHRPLSGAVCHVSSRQAAGMVAGHTVNKKPLLEPTCLRTCENEKNGRSYRCAPSQHHCALPVGCPCIMSNCRVVPTLQSICRTGSHTFLHPTKQWKRSRHCGGLLGSATKSDETRGVPTMRRHLIDGTQMQSLTVLRLS